MCCSVSVCASVCLCEPAHVYLFRKIDSPLMLRAAMRLPWLIAKCCVHVRVSVWLSVCAGDWQNPRRLRASCRKQSTGVILHSRPKHLNTQCSNSPKSDKAETHPRARAHTHTRASIHTRMCANAHKHSLSLSHTHTPWPHTNREKPL